MKVLLSLVPWLTVVLAGVTTYAAIIARHERVTTGLDVASATEGLEDQLRQDDDRNPTHHRRHEHGHHEHRHHEHLHRGHSGCPGCRQWQKLAKNSEEELIEMRIEKIKQDLLNRLGLSAPPNVSLNRFPENIPAPLQYNEDSEHRRPASLNDEDGDEPVERHSKQIIVFAEEVAFRHKHRPPAHRRHSLHFTLPSTVPVDTVLSVELWLYKNSDSDRPNCTNNTQIVSVHSLASDSSSSSSSSSSHSLSNRTSPHALASREVPPHAGWFRMDFMDAVQSWMADPRTNRGLRVEHSDCVSLSTDLSHQPFLTIGIRRGSARRQKRNAQLCHDGTQNCCRKHSLYINFRELGWNFIVSPQGYYANYCHGPCSVPGFENLMSTQRRHSSILQKFSRLRNNPDVLPCCSPTSLSSLSIIYVNAENTNIHEDLDNMRVDSCGCS